ncbi:hypothetical protein BG32_08120 [Mesotoga sp. HF07.pep.5.2.highcov]|uniref:Uncharacterized protein n=1 Tax=Mesotoga prima MesG1.Ag.4.2 TaxID=660470 RepID=I2F6Q3_9BACT|nr:MULTISPECIES: hypothetical protein [Mesotoga]AFK07606.1 hypothetical protein Theba_1963 [Mesotoga prima MesG1.Ag.4.2]RLL91887.1 hypothetical protein BG32_08120 [Mesotoga sp. HF07.pep.5.2.highcov]
MKIHVGGYGFQGLASIEYLGDFESESRMVLNGLAGYYVAAERAMGKKEALYRLSKFVDEFFVTLEVMDGGALSSKKRVSGKLERIRHCRIWSKSNHIYGIAARDSYLDGIAGKTELSAEVFNLETRKVELIRDDMREVAAACISIPGLFAPYNDVYVTTTYLSQIPVSFLSEGDTVILNLRDLSTDKPSTASEVVFRAMEIRSLNYAKIILANSSCVSVGVKTRVHSDNVFNYLDRVKRSV